LLLSLTNFKFGIGTGKDVFEGLSVYARTAGDYFETVYDYNIAVAELRAAAGEFPGPPAGEQPKAAKTSQ
jgi:hypothetical protein